MAEVTLTAAFSTIPGGDAEAIKRLLVETVEQTSAGARAQLKEALRLYFRKVQGK